MENWFSLGVIQDLEIVPVYITDTTTERFCSSLLGGKPTCKSFILIIGCSNLFCGKHTPAKTFLDLRVYPAETLNLNQVDSISHALHLAHSSLVLNRLTQ